MLRSVRSYFSVLAVTAGSLCNRDQAGIKNPRGCIMKASEKTDSVDKRCVAFSRLRDRDVVTKLFNDLGPRYPESMLPWPAYSYAPGANEINWQRIA